MATEIYPVKLTEIKVDKLNVRHTDRKAEIEELASSIRKHGQMQPIVLMGEFGTPPYKLIVGQRRFLAHDHLNSRTINATFIKPMIEKDALLYSLAENMQRVELNHADKAEAITRLYNLYDKDEKKVAKELGKNINTIREYINIEEQATEKAKKLLKNRTLSKTDAIRILNASGGDKIKADKLIDTFKTLSQFEKKRAVEYGKSNPKATVEDIDTNAKKQKLQETIIVKLPKRLEEALEKASRKILLDKDEVAAKAIEEWLISNGFMQK
jgi:ParB family chromosome partitioning protein